MNVMLKMDKKGCHSSGFFFFSFFFCASHCVMADLVPEEERKTLKQYRSVTSTLSHCLQSFMQVFPYWLFSNGAFEIIAAKSLFYFFFFGGVQMVLEVGPL